MITAKIINSEASVNQFKYLETVEFVVGTNIKFAFRLYDTELKERHVPPDTAIVKMYFNTTDDVELELEADYIAETDDRSMWYVEITAEQSESLLGGNARIELDVAGDGSDIKKGMIIAALSKIVME
jgi:hypothetical protein